MSFRLIDGDWHQIIRAAAKADRSGLRIVCPFIKREAGRQLIEAAKPERIEVITRFNLLDFYEGVSDPSALRFLLDQGAQIRGVKGLHAKLFLFGNKSALVTSANLTKAAMEANHELGFLSDDPEVVRQCRSYFDALWKRAGDDVSEKTIARWEQLLERACVEASRVPMPTGLRDEGTDAGLAKDELPLPVRIADSQQAFVKFFGDSTHRSEWSRDVLESVGHSGCHFACTYPKNKRPRIVQDGDIMFMARLVKDPNDIVIYGRAIGLAYVESRDDAGEDDLKARPWKRKWPHYIRVHHPEFVSGTLANGIRLSALIEALGSDVFATTYKRAKDGEVGINPQLSYKRQPQVRLSVHGQHWLNQWLESAFQKHGKLTNAQLKSLDAITRWPDDDEEE